MSNKVPKPKRAGAGKDPHGLRKDVLKALKSAWPHGEVESFDQFESYFSKKYVPLSKAFRRIYGAYVALDRAADEEPEWDDSEDDEDLKYVEPSRSYHLFFVTPYGESFTFATETQDYDVNEFEDYEDGDLPEEADTATIPGTGTVGWVVAVSLVAPFVILKLGDTVAYEDGSATGPALENIVEDGEALDPNEEFRNVLGREAFDTMQTLRNEIAQILERFELTVLPEEELRKPVPWLSASEEIAVGKTIRVLDAFFFECLE